MKQNAAARLNLIVSMLIFGTIGIVRRYIPYSSGLVAFARAVIGILFLLLIKLIRGEKLDRDGIKKNWVLILCSGIIMAFNWILLFEAYNFTTVSIATVCYYMSPMLVMLASPILFGEKISLKKGLCAVFALLGMALMTGVIENGFTGLKGVFLGLSAAVLYAGVVILNKYIKGITDFDRTFLQLGTAAAVLLPYLLLTRELASIKPNGFALIMLAVAGILHTGIAYTLYFGSISRVPAQTAAILSYIDPVTAVLLSVLLLREGMTLSAAAGAVIMLAATVISELPTTKDKAGRERNAEGSTI